MSRYEFECQIRFQFEFDYGHELSLSEFLVYEFGFDYEFGYCLWSEFINPQFSYFFILLLYANFSLGIPFLYI